jgi:hypothetical protein
MRTAKPLLFIGILALFVIGFALPAAAADDVPAVSTADAPLPEHEPGDAIHPADAGDETRDIVIAPRPDTDPEEPPADEPNVIAPGPEEPMVISPAETDIAPNPEGTIGLETAEQNDDTSFPYTTVLLAGAGALLLLGAGAWVLARNR